MIIDPEYIPVNYLGDNLKLSALLEEQFLFIFLN